MRNSLIVSSVLLCLLSFSYAAKNSKGIDSREPSMGNAERDGLLARVDGKEITLSDMDYDIRKRYDFELHNLEVKLYREQRSQLDKIVDRILLEKEAARRKITPDELVALLDAKAREGTKAIEADKERLFQEFLDDIQKRNPQLSKKMPPDNQRGLLQGLPAGENGAHGPLMENAQKNIIEMKKEAHLRSKKKEFFDELRTRAQIEILLERPELINLNITADDDPYLGRKDAKITIIEFADYQCPFCTQVGPTLKDLLAKKGDKVKVVFRDFPLPSHKNAAMAAEAAECADEQGKFWAYNELLFSNQQSLSIENLSDYAKDIGLNTEKFNRCLASGIQRSEVEKDAADAKRAGITSTPSIFINGYYVSGMPTLAYLEEVIADIEKGRIPRVEEDAGKG
jgi:protein-disulfide isomerase